jgi:hypothetical protein
LSDLGFRPWWPSPRVVHRDDGASDRTTNVDAPTTSLGELSGSLASWRLRPGAANVPGDTNGPSSRAAGLAAKSLIGVQVSVGAFEPIEAFKDPLERLGYVYRADSPERTKRYFREAPEAGGPTFMPGALEAFPANTTAAGRVR